MRDAHAEIGANKRTGGFEARRDLILNGRILPVLLILVWPFILQTFLQMMTGFVDQWMVGRFGIDNSLGPDPLTAIGLSRNALMIIFSLAMGIGIGLSTMVAQCTGAGDHGRAVTVAVDTFWFVLIFSILITIFGRIYLGGFIPVYHSSETVNSYVYAYLIVFIDFMPIVLISMVVFSLMQGIGDTLTPTLILITMNLCNIVLNWFLIPGPEVLGFNAASVGLGMGIKGAAVGTVLSRLIGCVIAFSLIFSGRYRVDMRKAKRFLPAWSGMLPVLRIGLPSAFQFISRNISVMLLNIIISYSVIHEKAQAALGTGFQIEWLPFGPAMAMMQASSIIIGQSIGAGRTERAEKAAYTAFGFAFWIMCLNALLFWFYPDKLAMIFTNDDEVIASLSMYLRIIGISDIFLAALVFAGGTRAAGDAFTPMLINVMSIWVIRIPIAWLLMFYTKLDYGGVWYIMGFSQVIQGIALYFQFRIGRWKKINLIARELNTDGAP